MFKVGDYVVNAANGICRINEIVQMDLSGTKQMKDYYLLVPVEEVTAKIYIPVDIADKRIRRVVNKDEAWQIIDRISGIDEAWIKNEKEREKEYKEVIASCDLERLVGIIKNMYHRMQERTAMGKKSTAVDERYFKLAEDHLYAELAFALKKDKKSMQEHIKKHIEEQKVSV